MTARRLRRDRARLPPGDGRRRRGDHPGARLVLLRADAARRPTSCRSRCRSTPERFDLDLAAIDAAITPRTRMVVVNSPHNPTGRIYAARRARGARRPARDRLAADRRADLAALRRALPAHPLRRRRLHEPGRDLSLDADRLQLRQGAARPGPAPRLPGALAADAGGRAAGAARRALPVPDGRSAGPSPTRSCSTRCRRSRTVSIDIAALAARRDRMLGALEQWGYRMTRPEGTFYLWGAAPGRRRGPLRRRARGARRLRHARHPLRAAGRLPHLADRQRRHDRARPARVRGHGLRFAAAAVSLTR